MRKFSFVLIALISASLVIVGCSSSKDGAAGNMGKLPANNALLQYNPAVGQSGTMVVTMDMDIAMEVMGQEMNTTQTIEMASKMKVAENTSETVKTTLSYDYFAMAMDIPMMGKMEYDTRNENNEGMLAESLGAVFGELMDEEMTMVQTHTGQTLRIEGMESLADLQQGNGNFNVNSLLSMSQFPEKPVAVGDSWQKRIDDETMPMAFDATYTLKKISEGKVYIDIDSDVTSNPKFKSDDEETSASEVKGKQSGTMIYEEGTMWFLEGIMNQDFDMTANQMGMEIPMKMKTNIIMVME